MNTSTVDQRASPDTGPRHVALFVRSLSGGGGAERVMVNLATELNDQGHQLDLVMGRKEGHFLDEIPPNVKVIDLQVRSARQLLPTLLLQPRLASSLIGTVLKPKAPWILGAVPGLAEYLKEQRPSALLAALSYTNVAALLACRVADSSARMVISVHNHLSVSAAQGTKERDKSFPQLAQRWYPEADGIVCVSDGVAADLARVTRLPRERIRTIFNPVFRPAILTRAQEPLAHRWFSPDAPPVLLGIGKLKPQKDFPSLLRAFARIRAERPARLIILGEGPRRKDLQTLARKLRIHEDVELPGFVPNPFAYLRQARVFVLSSAWEGLSNVIIEALACGCPVVSTDCPSGPAELLDHGNYGALVPVGNDEALAAAILQTLAKAHDRDRLLARAKEFSVERATKQYSQVLLGV